MLSKSLLPSSETKAKAKDGAPYRQVEDEDDLWSQVNTSRDLKHNDTNFFAEWSGLSRGLLCAFVVLLLLIPYICIPILYSMIANQDDDNDVSLL
jgi:hypothetical protein